ncbi:MAG: hypothetical protein GY946_12190 [bacterium]|nr:hypothetical protein [bacterium]
MIHLRHMVLGAEIRAAAILLVVSGIVGAFVGASWADSEATSSKTSPQGKTAETPGKKLPEPIPTLPNGAADASKLGAPKLPATGEAGSPVRVKPADPRREPGLVQPSIPGERVPIDGRLPHPQPGGDRGRPALSPPGSVGVQRALATLLRLDGRTGSLERTESGDSVVPAEWHFADPAVDFAVLHVGTHPSSCPAAGTSTVAGVQQLEARGGTLLVEASRRARDRLGFDLDDFRFRGLREYHVMVCGLARDAFTGERTNVVRVVRAYLAMIHAVIIGAEYRDPDPDFLSPGVAIVTVRMYSPEGETVPGTQLRITDFDGGTSGPCLPGGGLFEVPELPESGYVEGRLGFRCRGWGGVGDDLCVALTINNDGRVPRRGGSGRSRELRACVGGGSRDHLALTRGAPHRTARIPAPFWTRGTW